MDTKLKEILENSKSMSDVARAIFGKENYTNREKCKKILAENNIDWEEWLAEKKIKPKRYCLYCGKTLTKASQQKFCNQSCAASYNNINRAKKQVNKKSKTECLNCGKKLTAYQDFYCSTKCQSEYEYQKYIERWKNGEENGQSGVGGVSSRIRRYLFGKYNNSCELCGWSEENEYTHKIPLQIHHIDGDCTNNKEENLQLLCPNCHSLTETFGSNCGHRSQRIDRRKKYYRDEIEADSHKKIEDVSRCVVCGKKLETGQVTFCSDKCRYVRYMKNLTKDEILSVFHSIENVSYAKVAKILGISTTCLVRKCENFGIKNEIQKIRFGN